MRKNVKVVNEDRSTKGGMMNYYILRRPKMSFGEIASKVLEKWPDANTKANTVATYNYNLKKAGVKVPQRKRGRIAGTVPKGPRLKNVSTTKAPTAPTQSTAELTAVLRKQNKIFQTLTDILTSFEDKLTAPPPPPAAPKAKVRSRPKSKPKAPEAPKQEAQTEGPKQEAAVA